MTAKQKRLIADLLDLAADKFANHSCNDHDLPDDWTESERIDLMREMHAANGDDPETFDPEEQPEPGDWLLMRHFAMKLREDA